MSLDSVANFVSYPKTLQANRDPYMYPILLSHFWISATCGENKYFYLVSLLEITSGQLLKGPHGIQLLGGLK